MRNIALILASVLLSVSFAGNAISHEFGVALIISTEKEQGKQFLEGFLLATAERDSHPNEESDGHLGGLDVYVTIIDPTGMNTETGKQKLIDLLKDESISIIVTDEAGSIPVAFMREIANYPVAILNRGKMQFANKQNSGVVAFYENFEKRYAKSPSPDAARGYNAARRIDFAVRPLDSTDETDLLTRSFSQTSNMFEW